MGIPPLSAQSQVLKKAVMVTESREAACAAPCVEPQRLVVPRRRAANSTPRRRASSSASVAPGPVLPVLPQRQPERLRSYAADNAHRIPQKPPDWGIGRGEGATGTPSPVGVDS